MENLVDPIIQLCIQIRNCLEVVSNGHIESDFLFLYLPYS